MASVCDFARKILKSQQAEQGMILVSVLLFLFALSLLMTAHLELHLLETKMSENNYHRIVTFEAAEAGLMAAEASIQGKSFSLPSSGATVNYHIQLMGTDACDKKRYRITADALFHRSKVALLSEYEYLLSTTKRACKKEVINRRTYWKRL